MVDGVKVNDPAGTRNVAAFMTLLDRVVNRKRHLSGLGVFFGPTGFGKTQSAVYGANKYQAPYVQCGQYTTAKSLLTDILTELGVRKPRGAITDLIKEAVMAMSGNPRRPLLVDETQYIAQKRFVNVLYELSEKSGAPVLMIGEESLPQQLEAFERVAGRVLEPVGALPCDMEDFVLLARKLCPSVKIADDLAAAILSETKGNTRKIVNNLARIEEMAAREGLDRMDLATFGGSSNLVSIRRPLPRRVA